MPQSGVLFWKSSVFQVKSHVLSTNEVSCNVTESETIWNKQTKYHTWHFFFKEEKFSSCETRWKKCWKRVRKQSRGSKIPSNRFFRETFHEFQNCLEILFLPGEKFCHFVSPWKRKKTTEKINPAKTVSLGFRMYLFFFFKNSWRMYFFLSLLGK